MEALARNWKWIALRGVAAIAFGILAIAYPGITVMTLVILFGVFAVVDGVAATLTAIANRRVQTQWAGLLAGGIVAIVIGVGALIMPGMTAMALIFLIAAWAIVMGIAQIIAALQLRRVITGELLMLLAGAASIGFGALIALFPGRGALVLAVWIGVYAIGTGLLTLALALELRSWRPEEPRRESLRRAA